MISIGFIGERVQLGFIYMTFSARASYMCVYRAGVECPRGGAGGYEELSEWHARVQVWHQR